MSELQKRKKVFLVIPDLSQGGAERVMSELANQLSTTKHKIHLVLLAKAKDFYQIEPEVIVHRLGFENKGLIQKKFSELHTFLKLRKLLKLYKPDVVLSFMDKYNVFTVLASSFLGIKVFVSDRSNPKLTNSFLLQQFKKFTYKRASGILAQTQMAKDLLQQLTKNKNIHVVPNPVKHIRLYPSIEREKVILNVGRLVPEKGQGYLLEAFEKVKNNGWRLVIIGDGPLNYKLKQQAIDLKISERVIFTGSITDVDTWYAKASIFAFTSVSEGFPNALIEAMAAGLPCVSFDCDAGPRDIIKNNINGLLVPVADFNKMADSLNILIDNIDIREKISREAIKVRHVLSSEIISEQYLQALTVTPPKNNSSLM